MNIKDKLILFGPPGVGKSTIGRMLTDYGYHYFDGDAYSLPEGVVLNHQGKGMTPELRDRDYAHIIDRFLEQTSEHNKIVMDYHFMFDRYRINLRQLDSSLRWVYLAASFQDVEDRFHRPGHLLSDLVFIKKIFGMFEEPSFDVKKIDALLPVEEVVRQVLDF